jgi:2-methylcitrate dehydratase PrpD
MHGGSDCFCQIIEENSLQPAEIREVNLLLHLLAALPIWQNKKVETHVDAQFNVPQVFAVAAHRLRLNLWQDQRTMHDSGILRFMSKIKWTPHPSFAKEMLNDFCSRQVGVEAVAKDGRKLEKGTKYLRGSSVPGFELNNDALINKFSGNARNIFSRRKTDDALESILGLEKARQVDTLMASLSGD